MHSPNCHTAVVCVCSARTHTHTHTHTHIPVEDDSIINVTQKHIKVKVVVSNRGEASKDEVREHICGANTGILQVFLDSTWDTVNRGGNGGRAASSLTAGMCFTVNVDSNMFFLYV